MNDEKVAKYHFRYLFGNWEDELVLAASDAVECCITSAFLNSGSISLLQKIAQRLAFLSSKANHMPIRILVSKDFAPTDADRLRIILAFPICDYSEHSGTFPANAP